MIYLIALATFCATLLGGLFALRFKDKLHLILGFSAGAVIGVAFFDLLPESLELNAHAYTPATTCTLVAVGFLAYLVLDRLVLFHAHHHAHIHEGHEEHTHSETALPQRGLLGAASMCLHSFLDGVAIGLAFQVSAGVGYVVAFAVLAHDFSDGVNTINFLIKNNTAKRVLYRWLFVDAFAPVLGVASTLLFSVPDATLGAALALFTGFFIYIGASELIPESYHNHPKLLTTLMTVLGIALMFVVIQLAHGSGLHAH